MLLLRKIHEKKKRLYQILGYVKNGRGNGKMEPAFEVFRKCKV